MKLKRQFKNFNIVPLKKNTLSMLTNVITQPYIFKDIESVRLQQTVIHILAKNWFSCLHQNHSFKSTFPKFKC